MLTVHALYKENSYSGCTLGVKLTLLTINDYFCLDNNEISAAFCSCICCMS